MENKRFIDYRSDTVTRPTPKMREAMANAIVGDDVFQDDYTIQKLENLGASILGKEAGLFVASGTMGNQIAVMTHMGRGQEMVIGEGYHIVSHENKSYAMLSGVSANELKTDNGVLYPELVKAAIRDDSDLLQPEVGLVCMENTIGNGCVAPLSVMKEVYNIAKEKNVPVHLDGARLFNAATALGVEAIELANCADTVMICLSKGLGAPVGSLLVGSKAFIAKARKNRKRLGGGMRQVGILGAAGIIALEEMTKRLHIDHDNAKYMAEGFAKMEGVELDLNHVQTNMVFFKASWSDEIKNTIVEKLEAQGILSFGETDGWFRYVTHNDITREDIDYTLEKIREIIAAHLNTKHICL